MTDTPSPAEHTKGDMWEVGNLCVLGTYSIWQGDRLIAEVYEADDASLIAAACELSAALELFAKLELPTKSEGNAGFYSIPFKRIEQARAAIARAHGAACKKVASGGCNPSPIC